MGQRLIYDLIVVGSGLAGCVLAREWRRRCPNQSLLIVTQDEGHYYLKPTLSQAFALKKEPQQLIQKTAKQLSEELNAEVVTSTSVQQLLLEDHKIECSNGACYFYRNIALALGSTANRQPTINALPSINNWKDYQFCREKLAQARRIAIVGGGLVGVEFAHDWASQGYEIDLIHDKETPLQGLLPSFIGEVVRDALIDLGVHWHPNTQVIDATLNKIKTKEMILEADWAVACTGLSPNIQLAQEAGLEVRNAVCVDAMGATNHPNVYALGECAEVLGVHAGYIAPLREQACAIAQTLSGVPTIIPQAVFPIVIKTPTQPTVLAFKYPKKGRWEYSGYGREREAVLRSENEMTGFALTGVETTKKRVEWIKRLRDSS